MELGVKGGWHPPPVSRYKAVRVRLVYVLVFSQGLVNHYGDRTGIDSRRRRER